MEKIFLYLLFIGCSALSFGKGSELKATIMPIQLKSSEVDSSLAMNESVFHFNFSGLDSEGPPHTIEYTIDGKKDGKLLITGPGFDVKTTPGEHEITFSAGTDYEEIKTFRPLKIEGQHYDSYNVQFTRICKDGKDIIVVTCKPVIYLYPEEKTDVSVQLDFEGENPILYPEYNDGWNCTAHPNGDLAIGDDTYNYLFWEAEQPDHLSNSEISSGFIVEGKNAISFLKKKLTTAGLTSKEQADFITFWAPLIQKNDLNFVRFEFNSACDKFTELNINPKPDNVYRIYIFFGPVDEAFEIEEQHIESIDRKGFTVLEWGGQRSSKVSYPLLNL